MSDFLIQFGHRIDPERMSGLLGDPPGLENRPYSVWNFEWGTVAIQTPPGQGYSPHMEDGVLFGCTGRPRITGHSHESAGHNGFSSSLSKRWRVGHEDELFEQLTGTFSLMRCDSRSVRIMTDAMGALPVYSAQDGEGQVSAVGTSVELLSCFCQGVDDWDRVSLAELLVFNNISFPYTTRHGVTELGPAAVTVFTVEDDHIHCANHTLWEPAEPDHWQADAEMVDRLEGALQDAAEEITRGSQRVAVTLSGGLDSRAVLAAIPRDKSISAITYITHENHETEVARQVAAAAGIQHHFARRDSDYFANLLLDRGIRLLGCERRAAAHGYCIADSGLQDAFDVILGGQLSDTFLKHHYMPFAQRESLRHKGPRERLRGWLQHLQRRARPQPQPSPESTIGRHLAMVHLADDIREAVQARRDGRLAEVKAIRPETGEEWSRFWPTSRQDDLAHVLGNLRLFPFDTLFMQRSIIEVAACLSPAQRYGGRITNRAFARLYGTLGQIENANSGRAALAGNAVRKRQRRSHQARVRKDVPGAAPWNNVQSSWADNTALQKLHPLWHQARKEILDSPAIDVIEGLTRRSVRELVASYDDELPASFNQMLVQIGVHVLRLDRATAPMTSAPLSSSSDRRSWA